MRPHHALLAGLAVLLAATIVLQREGERDPVVAAVRPAAGEVPRTAPGPPPAELPPLDAFAAITERPLFHQSRRPPEPPPRTVATRPAAPPPPPPTLVGYELIGVVMRTGDRVALVRTPAEPRVEVRRGDSLGTWTVTDIDRWGIRLESGEQFGNLLIDQE